MRIYPKSQVVYRGGDIVIQCRDEGDVRADVYWARLDGNTLPQGRSFDNRGRLEISQAKYRDSGAYICKAKNHEHAYGGRSIAIVKVYRGFYFRY